MATAELISSLTKFATFVRSLQGDEKSEAQLFLDHFFRARGHGGVNEAGAMLEFRIANVMNFEPGIELHFAAA